MLCDSTKTLLRNIVDSLQTLDEVGWDDQIESGNQCLYEMHQMTRPSYQAYKTAGWDKWPMHVPDGAGLHRAMPHVKAMMRAIHRKDRATAIESGKVALDEMNGVGRTGASAIAKEELKAEAKGASGVEQIHSAKQSPALKKAAVRTTPATAAKRVPVKKVEAAKKAVRSSAVAAATR